MTNPKNELVGIANEGPAVQEISVNENRQTTYIQVSEHNEDPHREARASDMNAGSVPSSWLIAETIRSAQRVNTPDKEYADLIISAFQCFRRCIIVTYSMT